MSSTNASFMNAATVIFGIPRRGRNLEISEDVKALGLDMLRARPCELNAYAIPDFIQPRYGDYIANLPHYMYAYYHDENIDTSKPDVTVRFDQVLGEDLLPFKPIPVILSWGGPVPEETLDSIRTKVNVTDSISGGRPALVYAPTNWKDYDKVKGFNANIRAEAPIEHANIKAIIRVKMILAIFSIFIDIHSYPAFSDTTHQNNYAATTYSSETIFTDDDPRPDGLKFEPILSETPNALDLKVTNPIYINAKAEPRSPPTSGIADISGNLDALPRTDGIWFAYVASLASYDTTTVPDVIERYFMKCLGDSHTAIQSMFSEIRGDWAIAAKSATGKEITHLAKCIDIAIRAQARVVAVFQGGRYRGVFMSGAGYTVVVENTRIRPSLYQDVRDAVKSTDLHVASLVSIAKLVGNSDQQKAIMGCKSMLELRNKLLVYWTTERGREEILRKAQGLDFGEIPWAVNVSTLTSAISHIKSSSFNLAVEKGSDFPIHRSMLLTKSTLECVWSCFGNLAPSFRIPGGKAFDIGKKMMVETRGKVDTQKEMVRIAVRMKPLEVAVKDLRDTIDSKQILNPLVASKVRVSQRNMDRFFAKEDGRKLMDALMILCDISLSPAKRSLEGGDDEEEAPSKKRKTDDLDGW